jgi:hypothetical protein
MPSPNVLKRWRQKASASGFGSALEDLSLVVRPWRWVEVIEVMMGMVREVLLFPGNFFPNNHKIVSKPFHTRKSSTHSPSVSSLLSICNVYSFFEVTATFFCGIKIAMSADRFISVACSSKAAFPQLIQMLVFGLIPYVGGTLWSIESIQIGLQPF